MLFKSFSRQASLAKSIFAASNTSTCGFFVTTSQLKRQQSQLVSSHNSTFRSRNNSQGPNSGRKSDNSSYANPRTCASLCNSSSYTVLSPLSTLDEDKRREAIFAESVGSSGSCLIYSQQHSLVTPNPTLSATNLSLISKYGIPKRRHSMSILEKSSRLVLHPANTSRRRHSTPNIDNTNALSISDLPEDALKRAIPNPLEQEALTESPVSSKAFQTAKPLSCVLENTSPPDSSLADEKQDISTPQSVKSSQYSSSNINSLTSLETSIVQPSSSDLISHQLQHAINSDSFDLVLDSYNQFATHDTLPTTQDLESILLFLQTTKTVSLVSKSLTALEIYMDSMKKGVKPSVKIYSYIISNLILTASALKNSVSFPIYSNISRHATNPAITSSSIDTPILPSLKFLVSESKTSVYFVKLALQIFDASNSVHVQEYTPELYTNLIKACVDNGFENALYSIIHAYESQYTTLGPEAYIALVKGYGHKADLSAITECYNFYKLHAHTFGTDPKAVTMYSTLVTAYFDSNFPSAALAFLSKLLKQFQEQTNSVKTPLSGPGNSNIGSEPHNDTKPVQFNDFSSHRLSSLSPVVSAIVLGFAKRGDFKSCWRWIQKTDADPHLPPVDISTLVSVMKYTAGANVVSASEKLFGYMVSRKDSSTDEFNNARSDFLLLCVRTRNTKLLMKGITESLNENAVWDLMTLLYVTKYLVQLNKVDLAISVFNQQSQRYTDYFMETIPNSKDLLEDQATECLSQFMAILKQSSHFATKEILSLAKSSFFSPRIFSDNIGGQEILKTVWDEFKDGGFQLASLNTERDLNDASDVNREIEDSNPVCQSSSSNLTLKDILNLHLVAVKAYAAPTSSVSYPILDLKQHFLQLVGLFMEKENRQNRSEHSLSPQLVSNVQHSLNTLEEYQLEKEWLEFCKLHDENSNQSDPKFDAPKLSPQSTNLVVAPLAWDTTVTSDICLLAAQEGSSFKAFYELEKYVACGHLVGAEAYVSVIESAASQKSLGLIQSTYRLALAGLPHPDTHSQAWLAWVAVHRCIVTKAASLDRQIALIGYNHLLEMGASPCATGYGQLISNNVTLDNSSVPSPLMAELILEKDASEALRLFQESKNRGVPPNTFLYNVVLAKLARAHDFGTVFSVFEDMELTETARSSVTYGTMIHAFCLAGDEKQALKYFNKMESSIFYNPKVAPFNALIQFYVYTRKDRAAALEIYKRLKQRARSGAAAIQPSEHTYRLLIDAYTLIEPVDIKAADDVLLTIAAANGNITTRHYAALIFSRGVVCRDISMAMQFYETLTKQKGVRPDRHIFQAVIESLVACGQEEDIPAIFKEMVAYGVDLDDPYLADLLIRAWARHDLFRAVGLFEHCLQIGITDPSVFEAVIRAHAYHQDISSVESILALMQTKFGYQEGIVQKLENTVGKLVKDLPRSCRESVLCESSFRKNDAHFLQVLETASLSNTSASGLLQGFDSCVVPDKVQGFTSESFRESVINAG